MRATKAFKHGTIPARQARTLADFIFLSNHSSNIIKCLSNGISLLLNIILISLILEY